MRKNCLKMEKNPSFSFSPNEVLYKARVQAHISYLVAWASWAEALHWQTDPVVHVLPVFMGPCDLVSSLLQPVGRSQLEDAQHHKDAPDYVLLLSLVFFRMCNCSVCAAGSRGSLGDKRAVSLAFVPCSFWSFCLGTELRE